MNDLYDCNFGTPSTPKSSLDGHNSIDGQMVGEINRTVLSHLLLDDYLASVTRHRFWVESKSNSVRSATILGIGLCVRSWALIRENISRNWI